MEKVTMSVGTFNHAKEMISDILTSREEVLAENERFRSTLRWIAEEANTGESGDAYLMKQAAAAALTPPATTPQ